MVKYNTSIPTGFPFLFFSCFVQVIKTIYKTWPSLVFYFASKQSYRIFAELAYNHAWLSTAVSSKVQKGVPLSYILPIEKKINKTHFNFNTQEEITEERSWRNLSRKW